MRFRRSLSYWVCLLVWGGLAGCAGLQVGPEMPTLFPTEQLPTVIALTAQAAATQNPAPANDMAESGVSAGTSAATGQAMLTPSPSLSPTLTPTPTAQHSPTPTLTPAVVFPEADIQITNPGPLSKVVSPFTLTSHLLPGETRTAEAALWGEDGRLIYRRLFVFHSVNERTSIATKVSFETPAVAETARLVIQVRDEHDRVISLASLDLILLAEGEADLNTPGDHLAPIVIDEPEEKVLIQGDQLEVSGWTRMMEEHNLVVELVAADGRVVGSRLANVAPGPGGEHAPFVAEVPFQVDAPTWARVTVSERAGRRAAILQLDSIEVLLSP